MYRVNRIISNSVVDFKSNNALEEYAALKSPGLSHEPSWQPAY